MGERRPLIRRGVLSASYPMYPVRCLEDADATILWQHRQSRGRGAGRAVHAAGMTLVRLDGERSGRGAPLRWRSAWTASARTSRTWRGPRSPPCPRERRHTVAVIGAGTMGHGIAQVAAQAGYAVRLADAVPGAAAPALERVRANLDGGVQRGKLTRGRARRRAGAHRARSATPWTRPRGADLVIEAVPEDLDLKRALFAAARRRRAGARRARHQHLVALGRRHRVAATARPERVVGMHFFNPVHLMKLVEVVTHAGTGAPGAATRRSTARAPHRARSPSSSGTRRASRRAAWAWRWGWRRCGCSRRASRVAEDIDRAMTLGYNHPVGPLRLTDLVGLDVRLAIARYLHRALGDARFAPPALLERMVAEGKLGKKTGQGFYSWPDERPPCARRGGRHDRGRACRRALRASPTSTCTSSRGASSSPKSWRRCGAARRTTGSSSSR